MKGDLQQGIGDAWLSLAAELERRLQQDDPKAQVQVALAQTGLLQLKVQTAPAQLASARALARRYEERAHTICERCGGPVSSAGAGPVVTMLCSHCCNGG